MRDGRLERGTPEAKLELGLGTQPGRAGKKYEAFLRRSLGSRLLSTGPALREAPLPGQACRRSEEA